MNRVFKVLWSHSLGKWVVASELGRGRKKTKRTQLATTVAAAVMAGTMGVAGAAAIDIVAGEYKFTSDGLTPVKEGGKAISIESNSDINVSREANSGFELNLEKTLEANSVFLKSDNRTESTHNLDIVLKNETDDVQELKLKSLILEGSKGHTNLSGGKATKYNIEEVIVNSGAQLNLFNSNGNPAIFKFEKVKLLSGSELRFNVHKPENREINSLEMSDATVGFYYGGDLALKKATLSGDNILKMGADADQQSLVNSKDGTFIVSGSLRGQKGEDGIKGSAEAKIINKGAMHIGQDRTQSGSTRANNQFASFTLDEYEGVEGSSLHFGAELKNGGQYDQLIITKSATGESGVVVHQVGETEEIIKKGLALVKFDEGAEGKNDLELTLQKPVTDGMYNYRLALSDNNNWLLTNELEEEESPGGGGETGGGENGGGETGGGENGEGGNGEGGNGEGGNGGGENTGGGETGGGENGEGGNGEGGNTGGGNAGGKAKDYATQTSGYLAAVALSNEMFTHSYHDRLYVPGGNGLWTHINSSFGKFKSTLTDDISSKTNRVSIYIGKDLVSTNEFAVGLMAAYGYASGKSENNNRHSTAEKTDYSANGFALGVYGSYTFAPHSYVDAWAQYVHTRNKLEWGDKSEKFNAKGAVLSLEAGHAFDVADSVYFQPQGQITYMGVKADDHKIGNYTYSSDRGNVQLRLGARLFGENTFANGTGSPYVEANYLHNTKAYKMTATSKAETVSLERDGAKNLFQVKAGSEFKLNNNSKLGAHVSHTFGKKSYRDTQLNVNLRYDF